MREIAYTKRFRQDYKRIKKRGRDLKKLEFIVDALAQERLLPRSARAHRLSGVYSDNQDENLLILFVALHR